MKSIALVVNARLNSTRVPNKMIRPFADSTLIGIALEKLGVVSRMNIFDETILAAHDQGLIDICTDSNVGIVRRDADEVQKGIVDIRTRFKYFKHIESDYVMLLNPCCPLVSEQTIIEAYLYFQKHDYNSYTSAIKTRDWIFDMNSNAITRTDPTNVATNKGDYFYKATHMFHIINRKRFIDTGKIWTFTEDDPHCTLVSENEFYDVDTEDEFHMTEFAYKRANYIGEELVETKVE